MKTIEELHRELDNICRELDIIEKAQKDTSKAVTVDFSKIMSVAKRYPINNHPLKNYDEHMKKMYLLMIMSVAVMDDECYDDSILTLSRIAAGMEYTGSIEELFLAAKTIDYKTVDECTELFINSDTKLILFLECILVSAKFNKNRSDAISYLGELPVFLRMTKDEVLLTSNLARVVITQNLEEYKCEVPNIYDGLFDCYLGDFEFKYEIIKHCFSSFINGYKSYNALNEEYYTDTNPLYRIEFLSEKDLTYKLYYSLQFKYSDYLYGCTACGYNKDANPKEEIKLISIDVPPKLELMYYYKDDVESKITYQEEITNFKYRLNWLIFNSDLIGVAANSYLFYNRAIEKFKEAGGIVD